MTIEEIQKEMNLSYTKVQCLLQTKDRLLSLDYVDDEGGNALSDMVSDNTMDLENAMIQENLREKLAGWISQLGEDQQLIMQMHCQGHPLRVVAQALTTKTIRNGIEKKCVSILSKH